MLKEVKQNFENQVEKLIEKQREENCRKEVRFEQMIDNEELQSGLNTCLIELEK